MIEICQRLEFQRLFCEMKKGPDFFEKSEPILHFCEAEKRDRTVDRLNAIQAAVMWMSRKEKLESLASVGI